MRFLHNAQFLGKQHTGNFQGIRLFGWPCFEILPFTQCNFVDHVLCLQSMDLTVADPHIFQLYSTFTLSNFSFNIFVWPLVLTSEDEHNNLRTLSVI